MLTEDVDRAAIGKRRLPAHPSRHLGQHPPVGPSFAWRRAERPLARDASIRVRGRAILLAPARGRQHHIAKTRRIGRPAIGDDDKWAGDERLPNALGARHAGRRVGAEDPQRLDPTVEHRVEQLDRLQAGSRCDARCVPEPAHPIDIGVGETHVRGELVGETADLAPAHRIRLSGQRERPHAGPSDATGREVAVDDRIDLVGPGRRLVHPLRKERHRTLGGGEPIDEFG